MVKKPTTQVRKAHMALRDFAMSLPEAWEDFPWGERVVKVKKKVFVFLGSEEKRKERDHETGIGFGVKLPESAADALTLPYTEPSGYGLGKSGWVSVRIPAQPPMDLFESWIEESYRAVAPKKLAAMVGEDAEERPAKKKKPAKKPSKRGR